MFFLGQGFIDYLLYVSAEISSEAISDIPRRLVWSLHDIRNRLEVFVLEYSMIKALF